MSSLMAPWQNGPYKNQHTEWHKKHVEHHDADDDIHLKKLFFVFFVNDT